MGAFRHQKKFTYLLLLLLLGVVGVNGYSNLDINIFLKSYLLLLFLQAGFITVYTLFNIKNKSKTKRFEFKL
jgi:hypothetical protein